MGIEITGDDRWRVDRSLVVRFVRGQSLGVEPGWAGWHEVDGRVVGFEVRGANSCRGMLHHVGIRSKDIVMAVNGKPIVNYMQASRAVARLARLKQLEVTVLRGGVEKVLRYESAGAPVRTLEGHRQQSQALRSAAE